MSSAGKKRKEIDDGKQQHGTTNSNNKHSRHTSSKSRSASGTLAASQREGYRQEVGKIYSSYARLLKQAVHGDEPTADFQALLDAGQGSCAAARLAASLAPRFLHRFPHQLDATATLLMRLFQDKGRTDHEVESVLEATRADSLRGLGSVLEVATRLTAAEQAVPTVTRVVDFLLRQLHAQSTSGHRGLPHSPSTSAGGASLDFCTDAIDNLLVVQQLLEKAFRCFPRVLLSCCLQSFLASDSTLCRASLLYLDKHLLFERAPAAAIAGTPAGATFSSSASAPQARCLAAEVIGPLPDTQAWLLQALVKIGKDKRVAASKELHSHMDKLLRLVKLRPQLPGPPGGGVGAAGAEGLPGSRDAQAGAGPSGQDARANHTEADGLGAAHAGKLDGQPGGSLFPPGFAAAAAAAAGAGPPPPPPPPPSAAVIAAAAAAGAAAGGAPPQPKPGAFAGRGGPICRAAPCLYLACLPPAVSEAILKAECSKTCAVEGVLTAGSSAGAALGLGRGEAYVVFKTTIPDAAICYEAMADALPFGGSRPLHIEFCPAVPPEPGQPRGAAASQLAPYVWVSGHPLDEVLGVLRHAGLPNSERVVEVAGHAPGFMMDYSKNEAAVQPVVECLVARLRPKHDHGGKPQQQEPWQAMGSGHIGLKPSGGSGRWDMGGPPPLASVSSGPPSFNAWMHPQQQQQQQQHPPPPGFPNPHLQGHHHQHHHPQQQQGQPLPPGFMPHGGQAGPGQRSGFAQQGSYLPPPPHLPQQGGSMLPPQHGHHHHPQQQQQQGGPLPQQQQGPGQHHGASHLPSQAGQPPQPYPPHPQQQQHLHAQQQRQHMYPMHQPQPPGGGQHGGQHKLPPPPHLPGKAPLPLPHGAHTPSPSSAASPSPAHPNSSITNNNVGAHGGVHHPPGAPSPGRPPSTLHSAHSAPAPGVGGGPPPLLPGAASLPASLQQQQQQQQQWQQWHGTLTKSGALVCSLACAGGGGPGGGAPEPIGWPASLDVKLRVEIRYVQQLYCGTAVGARALRWLVPQQQQVAAAAAGQQQQQSDASAKFSDFVQYLASKERAGVIKLGAHGAAPSRTLYLVPPSDQVCAALGADWPPPPHLAQHKHVLLAVVVPTPRS